MSKIQAFIEALSLIEYEFDTDPYWQLLFINRRHQWFYLHVRLYNGVYYVSENINNISPVEIDAKTYSLTPSAMQFGEAYNPSKWEEILLLATGCIKNIQRNWLQEYRQLCKSYPYEYRTGRIHHKIIYQYCPDLFSIDKELGAKYLNEFVSKVEKGGFSSSEQGFVSKMSAAVFFDYCKIAYLNSKLKMDAKTKLLSGREMYRRFADSRDDGLLDIKPDSEKEFNNWINGTHPKRTQGGHPWEILRGGNTTNISLYITPVNLFDGNGYTVEIAGHAASRLAETIKIFLALIRNGCKVKIRNPEHIRRRLLGQDTIGIVPEYQSLHRSEQFFDDTVSDTIHLILCGRNKNKIIEKASWDELPCMKPKRN